MFKIEESTSETVLKFVSSELLTKGSFEFNNIDEVKNSNLIKQLFYLPFVKKVFVTANFIAVERYKIVEWNEVKNELKQLIESYYTTHGTIFDKESSVVQKVAIQVYTESTPNPNVNKFVCNKLLSKQIIDVKKSADLTEIPIAKVIIEKFDAIEELFIVDNYISVTKNLEIEWFEISNELRSFIRQYLQEEKPIVTKNYEPIVIEGFNNDSSNREPLDSISEEIISVLDEYIKPAVTADGGNIMFKSYNSETKIVEVLLQGACSGCPSSTITLKNGIEATLKQVLPNKINEVVAING